MGAGLDWCPVVAWGATTASGRWQRAAGGSAVPPARGGARASARREDERRPRARLPLLSSTISLVSPVSPVVCSLLATHHVTPNASRRPPRAPSNTPVTWPRSPHTTFRRKVRPPRARPVHPVRDALAFCQGPPVAPPAAAAEAAGAGPRGSWSVACFLADRRLRVLVSSPSRPTSSRALPTPSRASSTTPARRRPTARRRRDPARAPISTPRPRTPSPRSPRQPPPRLRARPPRCGRPRPSRSSPPRRRLPSRLASPRRSPSSWGSRPTRTAR